jgi:hypothetical protein
MALVMLGVGRDLTGERAPESGFDLGAERRLVGLHRQQIVRPGIVDGGGDGAIGGQRAA